jgi:hypothetical protein
VGCPRVKKTAAGRPPCGQATPETETAPSDTDGGLILEEETPKRVPPLPQGLNAWGDFAENLAGGC